MRTSKALIIVSLVALTGCFAGRGPGAYRVPANGKSFDYVPKGKIHFVEENQRGVGVLVSATAGGHNAFNVSWSDMLVPTAPSKLAGPAWSDRKLSKREALDVAGQPLYRNANYLVRSADLVRSRLSQQAVWILSTSPFIVGMADGKPLHAWDQYATVATGNPSPSMPVKTYIARLVTDEELEQPVRNLVIFPNDFLTDESTSYYNGQSVTIVTMPRPMKVDAVLDAIAAGDPARLGTTQQTPLKLTDSPDGRPYLERQRALHRSEQASPR